MSALSATVNKALQLQSIPSGRVFTYGTAGFRGDYKSLGAVMIRMGMLAAVRSLVHGGLGVGVCVTASHNPESDNGVKIVEPDGGMLVPEFEQYAAEFANSTTPFAALEALLKKATSAQKNSVYSGKVVELASASEDTFKHCLVFVAADTRGSSSVLSALVKVGVQALGVRLVDVGEATTPILHWVTREHNADREAQKKSVAELQTEYFDYWLARARDFAAVAFVTGTVAASSPSLSLVCDAAAGVGSRSMEKMLAAFEVFGAKIEVVNRVGDRPVNDSCGAEFVQKGRCVPVGIESSGPGQGVISLDGDADRVIFFVKPADTTKPLETLIDGDRLAVLFSKAISKMVELIAANPGPLDVPAASSSSAALSFAVVQTAYGNGASTAALRALPALEGVTKRIAIAKTGVKNVHHEAVKSDIGVYFESNGHGTVTYKLDKILMWGAARGHYDGRKQSAPLTVLTRFLACINDCVGDAIVDALVAIAAMRYLKLASFADLLKMYPDRQVVQAKVALPRATLNTLKSHPEHEQWLLEPAELQLSIDAIIMRHSGPQKNNLTTDHGQTAEARAFVRASGTEDACRVYAEASSFEQAKAIAHELVDLLKALAPPESANPLPADKQSAGDKPAAAGNKHAETKSSTTVG